ncbi:transposase [Zymomonas mobilis subsp. pomaceae]|uniref:transposase n=1 Tax=Zymomonas mobilis TaxID=542 RepID=UPI00210002ED|nr:transposase [Zymomonas mobilis]MDX5947838.1 transposase [Zymomonas mobilis subsp. pomaceae]
MNRVHGEPTDAEWEIIVELLPLERGRWSRQSKDNCPFLNGMLYVLWVGYPWRDIALWKIELGLCSFSPMGRTGVWDALLETLVELRLTDDWP